MNLTQFGQRYRLFLQLIGIVSRLPRKIAYYIAPTLAFCGLSPIDYQQNTVRKALIDARIKLPNMRNFWRKRRADHAIFCLNSFYHQKFDEDWLAQHVTLDKARLQAIAAKSPMNNILFLTYHHQFQHTLCCSLGIAGFRLQALAAAEEVSPIFSYIGNYIKRLHQGCSYHFNGGNYLFFNSDRTGVKLAKQALSEKGILISLNDFPAPAKISGHNPLFNRNATAPFGSVKLACRMGVPIVAGIMLRQGEDYRIIFREFESGQSPESIMADYFAYLEEIIIENPSVWSGWDWFSSFPLLEKQA